MMGVMKEKNTKAIRSNSMELTQIWYFPLEEGGKGDFVIRRDFSANLNLSYSIGLNKDRTKISVQPRTYEKTMSPEHGNPEGVTDYSLGFSTPGEMTNKILSALRGRVDTERRRQSARPKSPGGGVCAHAVPPFARLDCTTFIK
jgi:hypothetical protein